MSEQHNWKTRQQRTTEKSHIEQCVHTMDISYGLCKSTTGVIMRNNFTSKRVCNYRVAVDIVSTRNMVCSTYINVNTLQESSS